MYGNWRINLAISGVGSILVLLIAFINNTLIESLFRALYSFIAFTAIVYGMRFVFNTFILPSPDNNANHDSVDDSNTPTIDLQANDENLQELLKQQLSQSQGVGNLEKGSEIEQGDANSEPFKPLKPTQLFSNKTVQPEEMSKAIRHLTGE